MIRIKDTEFDNVCEWIDPHKCIYNGNIYDTKWESATKEFILN